MRVEVTNYNTGWLSIALLLKGKDIQQLTDALCGLKNVEPSQHFQVSNQKMTGESGIVDIEFIRDDESADETFSGPSGLAIAPQ